MPIGTKIAPIGKSYSALDFQADVVVRVNGGTEVYKLLHNIEIIAVCRDLGLPTRRQHIFRHFRRLRSIALNAAVTSRIVHSMMSMLSAYARNCTLL